MVKSKTTTIYIPYKIIQNPKIKSRAKVLASLLWWFGTKLSRDWVYARNQYFACRLHCTIRHVRRLLKNLVKEGGLFVFHEFFPRYRFKTRRRVQTLPEKEKLAFCEVQISPQKHVRIKVLKIFSLIRRKFQEIFKKYKKLIYKGGHFKSLADLIKMKKILFVKLKFKKDPPLRNFKSLNEFYFEKKRVFRSKGK